MVAVLHPLGPGRQIVLDRAVVLVGRSPDCDAVLDVSTKISRIHCALIQVDHAHYIRDLGSTNGIWVNGNRVERESLLANGNRVAIGDVQFQFHENVQPPVRKPAGQVQPAPLADVIDEVELVDDVDDVEVIDDHPVSGNLPTSPTHKDHRQRSLRGRPPQRSREDDVVLIPEIVSDVDEIEVVEEVEVIEVMEVVEDVEIVDVVEVIDEPNGPGEPPFQPRPRRPRR